MSITKIWNLFIKFSHFPKDCKVAKLKPPYKNDTKTYPKDFLSSHSLQNYRKSDNDQTMNYLTENNILYRYQSGFHKNH